MFNVKDEYKAYDHRRVEVVEYILAHGGLKKPKKPKYVEPETEDLDFDDNYYHASEELSERHADAKRVYSCMSTPDMELYDDIQMDNDFRKYCRAVASHIKKHHIFHSSQLAQHFPPVEPRPRRLVRSPEMSLVAGRSSPSVAEVELQWADESSSIAEAVSPRGLHPFSFLGPRTSSAATAPSASMGPALKRARTREPEQDETFSKRLPSAVRK